MSRNAEQYILADEVIHYRFRGKDDRAPRDALATLNT